MIGLAWKRSDFRASKKTVRLGRVVAHLTKPPPAEQAAFGRDTVLCTQRVGAYIKWRFMSMDIRCGQCASKLAVGAVVSLTIKCPRCKTTNHYTQRAIAPQSSAALTAGNNLYAGEREKNTR